MTDEPLKVLIVDDSAFARKVLSSILAARRGIEVVGIARDGLEALEQIEQLSPDVITLDLVMPHLDGLGLLQALPAERPAVVVVSMSDRESDLAVRALELGAFDLVHKPTALATDRLYEMADELVQMVRAAGASRARRQPSAPPITAPSPAPSGDVRVVCIGCSTGGPQALTKLIPRLPKDLPVPVCVVVHMPAGFTESLAQRLDEISEIRVVEARDGMKLEPGLVAVGPGGAHLLVQQHGGLIARVQEDTGSALYRPSVDLLFGSAAEAVGDGVLGVVLTGMGEDGSKGAQRIVDAGGRVLTESAASCVVHGMPRSVLEAGLSIADVKLDAMASAILSRL